MPRPAIISFFLLIVAGILYLGNIAVYETVAHMFRITDAEQLFWLGAGLGFSSASFIIATILGSWYYNRFTRIYYALSAVWMGVLAYLLLASAFYAIIVAIDPVYAGVGPFLFLIALLASAYGVIHARYTAVAHVTVSLPNLPPSWKGRRAVWISDLHLGQLHGLSFARAVVERITKLAPDIIFVGGDLYDGTGAPDLPELTAPMKKLAAPLGVYFITGNHEEFGNRELFLAAVASAGMHILMDEMILIDGLQLIGVDYHNASDVARFTKILSGLALDPKKPSVLLKHEPKDLDIAHAAGISLQVSGHTHNAQLWPLGYLAQLTYKGFAYGLKRFQTMWVYTSSGTGTWGPPMRVGTNSEIVQLTFE